MRGPLSRLLLKEGTRNYHTKSHTVLDLIVGRSGPIWQLLLGIPGFKHHKSHFIGYVKNIPPLRAIFNEYHITTYIRNLKASYYTSQMNLSIESLLSSFYLGPM